MFIFEKKFYEELLVKVLLLAVCSGVILVLYTELSKSLGLPELKFNDIVCILVISNLTKLYVMHKFKEQ
jgi:hypothetical protein